MKVIIERPGEISFGKLGKGRVFEHQGGVYIKSTDAKATAIYKTIGHMTAGQLQDFNAETVVQYVSEITFKVG